MTLGEFLHKYPAFQHRSLSRVWEEAAKAIKERDELKIQVDLATDEAHSLKDDMISAQKACDEARAWARYYKGMYFEDYPEPKAPSEGDLPEWLL